MKHVCDICGWVYDEEVGVPEQGIAPGTKFNVGLIKLIWWLAYFVFNNPSK